MGDRIVKVTLKADVRGYVAGMNLAAVRTSRSLKRAIRWASYVGPGPVLVHHALLVQRRPTPRPTGVAMGLLGAEARWLTG